MRHGEPWRIRSTRNSPWVRRHLALSNPHIGLTQRTNVLFGHESLLPQVQVSFS